MMLIEHVNAALVPLVNLRRAPGLTPDEVVLIDMALSIVSDIKSRLINEPEEDEAS